jgi:lipid A 3-O-deacylase
MVQGASVSLGRFIACAGALTLGTAAVFPVGAGAAEEIRLGVMAHNICVDDCDNANKESDFNIIGEAVFASPKFLRAIRSPRPYLVVSTNTEGGTSYAGGGLTWLWPFADGWAFEPSFGYVLHDGEHLTNPYPPSDARRGPFQESELLLGSRDLFRTSVAVTRDITPAWGVQVAYEHVSHGQIIGSGPNHGLDELGVRLRYRFRD